MQTHLTKQQVEAEDRRVGFTVGAIGVAVSLFMAATVAGLSVYYQSFYSYLR